MVVNISVSMVFGLMVSLNVFSIGIWENVSRLKLVMVVRLVISSDISVWGVMVCVC